MPLISYKDVDVVINGSGILASNVSLSTNNTLSPINVLGYQNPINQTNDGPIKSTLSINYYLDTSFDANYNKIQSLKNYNNDIYHDNISFAGISGAFYLDTFEISAEENQMVRCNATYSCYNKLSGTLQQKTNTINYNATNNSGLANAWTVFISNQSNYTTNPTYSFGYSFSNSWKPIYSLGNVFPTQIVFLGAIESFSFERNQYTGVLFSGQSATDYLAIDPSGHELQIFGLAYIKGISNYYITLGLSGAKITSNSVVGQVDDFIKIRSEAANYW
jgi:hypothetical protein